MQSCTSPLVTQETDVFLSQATLAHPLTMPELKIPLSLPMTGHLDVELLASPFAVQEFDILTKFLPFSITNFSLDD